MSQSPNPNMVVKECSSQQRKALPDEPYCIICGRYGEYICDETDDDICSLECKSALLNHSLNPPPLLAPLAIQIRNPINDECFYVRDEQKSTKQKHLPEFPSSFTSFDLPHILLSNLHSKGYKTPTPIQIQAIPLALSGRSLLASSETGSGKTCSFLVPVLTKCMKFRGEISNFQKNPLAIVLSPTRELCVQLEEEAKSLGKGLPFKTALVVGGDAMAGQIHRIRQGIELVVATPGRLIDLLLKHEVDLGDVSVLVVDEVDCMMEKGFHDQVMQIFQALYQPQVLMFSATLNPSAKKMAESLAKDLVVISAGGRVNRPNIAIKHLPIWVEPRQKKHKLLEIIGSRRHFDPPVIVFVASKVGADLLSDMISSSSGLRSSSIHGDKTMKERREVMRSFLAGETEVLVATGVLGRGLDVLSVKQVIVFDMPNSIQDYVHQVGRASRLGEEGTAFVLVSEENRNIFPEFVELLRSSGAPVPPELAASYPHTSTNRVKRKNVYA